MLKWCLWGAPLRHRAYGAPSPTSTNFTIFDVEKVVGDVFQKFFALVFWSKKEHTASPVQYWCHWRFYVVGLCEMYKVLHITEWGDVLVTGGLPPSIFLANSNTILHTTHLPVVGVCSVQLQGCQGSSRPLSPLF